MLVCLVNRERDGLLPPEAGFGPNWDVGFLAHTLGIVLPEGRELSLPKRL